MSKVFFSLVFFFFLRLNGCKRNVWRFKNKYATITDFHFHSPSFHPSFSLVFTPTTMHCCERNLAIALLVLLLQHNLLFVCLCTLYVVVAHTRGFQTLIRHCCVYLIFGRTVSRTWLCGCVVVWLCYFYL